MQLRGEGGDGGGGIIFILHKLRLRAMKIILIFDTSPAVKSFLQSGLNPNLHKTEQRIPFNTTEYVEGKDIVLHWRNSVFNVRGGEFILSVAHEQNEERATKKSPGVIGSFMTKIFDRKFNNEVDVSMYMKTHSFIAIHGYNFSEAAEQC